MGKRAGSHIILTRHPQGGVGGSSVVSPDTTHDRPHGSEDATGAMNERPNRSEDATMAMNGCSVVSPDTTHSRPYRSEDATMAMGRYKG